MTANHIGPLYPATGMGFGLGFAVPTDVGAAGVPGSVGEFGWSGAYHSTYWVDPMENLVIVYFTQVIPGGGLDDHARLRALVYASIVEPVRRPDRCSVRKGCPGRRAGARRWGGRSVPSLRPPTA
jgi:CubicO group peptidase (beta-lactamase class C family)